MGLVLVILIILCMILHHCSAKSDIGIDDGLLVIK